ncbi:MAG: DUF3090 family protein [Anaerolineae bacterium]
MADLEIELNPAEFLTLGTVGPKGRRVFYLQAASGDVLISLIIEKEQARALGDAIQELLEDLDERYPARSSTASSDNLDLREPINPRFRVAQMGLGYDEDRDLIVLVAQAMANSDPAQSDEEDELPEFDLLDSEDDGDEADDEGVPSGSAVARIWCSRGQLRALGDRAAQSVAAGRPDPRQNGRLIYYWT